MSQALKLVFLSLTLAGCNPSIASAPPDVAATAPTSAPPAPTTQAKAEQRAEEGSRYQVGDYVVYRYTGTYSELPVSLRERVLEKHGFKLVIEVSAERGPERRSWVQMVTDTPENREKNLVDELYEIVGQKRHRLANVENRDLLRLSEWTIPPCTGGGQDAGKVDLEIPVAGVRFKCSCRSVLRDCAGKPAHVETCDCPDFVWTHASGEARPLDDPKPIWKAEVEKFGNAHDR